MSSPLSPTTKKPKPRRRKKRHHYITGTHVSPKCLTGPANYRSGWELVALQSLDRNPDVLNYAYEGLQIPYTVGKSTKQHVYYPDLLVTYSSRPPVIIEIKRADKLGNRVVMAKAAAARAWILSQNPSWSYEFWTDAVIDGLRKLYALSPTVSQSRPRRRR